jgi:LPXTG-motif cell wall-anchored protein
LTFTGDIGMKPAPSRLRYAAPLPALVAILAAATPVAAAPAGAPPAGFTAYVTSSTSRNLTLIDVNTGKTRDSIETPSAPQWIAVTPDGVKAYVARSALGTMNVVDLETGAVGKAPILVGGSPLDLAMAPDGRAAYVATDVLGSDPRLTSIATDTDKIAWSITLPFVPRAIAVAPDGKTAYAVGPGEMVSVDLENALHPVGKPLDLDGRSHTIAITPDGTTAFVGYAQHVQLVTLKPRLALGDPVTLPDNGLAAAVPVAIAPDGRTAYAANNDAVYPIDVASGGVGPAIPVNGNSINVAVAPDGKTIYVVGIPGIVTPISIIPNGYKAGKPITVGQNAFDVVFSPDQAPVAKVAVHPGAAGQATGLDASTSTVKYGTIASYRWDFGDGSTATTTSAKTTHMYGKVGKYTVTVTETDSAGTSTSVVFTGSTVSRNGGPSAIADATFSVGAAGTPAPVTSAPGRPAAGGSAPLPNTGTNTMPMLYGAVGLLLAGSLALIMGRRRHLASHRPSL